MSINTTWELPATSRLRPVAPWLAPVLVAAAYFLGAQAAFAIGTLTQQFAPFWPPNVVLLCALLVTPRRHWPLIVAATFPAHLLAERGMGMPLPQILAAFGCNISVAVLNALALPRLLRPPTWLGSLRNAYLYLLCAVFACPALVAFTAAFEPTLGLGHIDNYGQYWLRWWLSNALANLTLTPVFLAWVPNISRPTVTVLDRGRLTEALLIALGLAISCAAAFETRLTSATADLFPAVLYLPIPFLLAAAVRFGTKGASGSILIFTVAALIGALNGQEPVAGGPWGHSIASAQLFIAVVAIPALLLAAMVEELWRANAERAAAELAATGTKSLLQSSLDALTAQIAILDGTGRIVAANKAWQQMAEIVAQSGERYLVGANYIEICESARPHQRTIAAGLRQLIEGTLEEFRFEYSSDFVEDGWFQIRGTCFGSGDELALVVAHENISEVKQSEGALRRLTGRLLRLQDEERRRIARELHDSTAQNLLGATLGIGQALRLIPRLRDQARLALEESRDLIEQSQREIRTVAYLLHPPMLDEAGLPAALRWLSDGFAKRTEIKVELDIASTVGRLPAQVEAALFRVAQEALTNVHRHSGSPTARIGLHRDLDAANGPSIALAIEDKGRGMPSEPGWIARPAGRSRSAGHLGIGLAGMRERLHQLRGHLEIQASPRGTTVWATVPLSAENGDAPGDGPLSETTRGDTS